MARYRRGCWFGGCHVTGVTALPVDWTTVPHDYLTSTPLPVEFCTLTMCPVGSPTPGLYNAGTCPGFHCWLPLPRLRFAVRADGPVTHMWLTYTRLPWTCPHLGSPNANMPYLYPVTVSVPSFRHQLQRLYAQLTLPLPMTWPRLPTRPRLPQRRITRGALRTLARAVWRTPARGFCISLLFHRAVPLWFPPAATCAAPRTAATPYRSGLTGFTAWLLWIAWTGTGLTDTRNR